MQIKVFLPRSGKREFDMPQVPRPGDNLYFEDTPGLGCINTDNGTAHIVVKSVAWTQNDAGWDISVDTEFPAA